jgi:hypothetical protein
VHDERQWIAVTGLEIRRLDQVAVDLFVIPAREAELLVIGEQALIERVAIQVGQLAGSGAGQRLAWLRRVRRGEDDRVQVGGMGEVALRVEHLARTQAEAVDLAVAGERPRFAGLDVDGPEPVLPEIVGGRDQRFAVA